MKKNFSTKIVVLLTTILTTAFIFVGCDSLDDAKHNSEESRDGVSGYSMTMTVNPSRAPANNNATMQVNIRFFRTKDRAPVPNTLIRVKIDSDSYEYLDPYIVHFEDYTLLTDVITNASGEATLTMYVGGLGKSVPELIYRLDAQGTVEYEKWNTLIYEAHEFFWIYNPHWDGTLPPDDIKPTAILYYYPESGLVKGDTVTFLAGNSYDRGATTGEAWNKEKAYDEIVQYMFTFGDGQSYSGSESSREHTYNVAGSFTVGLKVVDDEGVVGETSKPITIATPVP